MKQQKNNFHINNEINGSLDTVRMPFISIKEDILGPTYELSLAFVDPKKAQELNITYRKKEYIPNILSFPLDVNSGEIIICPKVAKAQAPLYKKTFENYILFLFIHGCFHLKGYTHGSLMEREEKKIREKYLV